ncbi:MAG: serine/threonine protein kinase [Kofleriaceae bacterium]|nr:serine/threonine protein kinase [Kofleriaceae bacterium]
MKSLGRYELVRPLARGGMADVYLARRKVAGVEKRLVIKRMRRERVADPRALDLFVKEAQLSMSLVQQNIVPVFDFGRIGEDVFLAMEHVDGKDVGSTLARLPGQRVAPVMAAFIAAECCTALDHAHQFSVGTSRGIVHRDVTPRNILLSWSGDVKLADFGIAAAVGDAQRGIIGTPAYMAPEQARAEEVDGRADIYSLGLVLWELLVGGRVRAGDERNAMMAAARNNELPECTDETLPEPLRRIVLRATATAPADRFASARDMLEALDTYIVAARAASAEGSPRNAITAWLALTWQGEQDATAQSDIAEPGAIVTFLDDGVAGVLGTATQHSVAVTADEVPSPPAIAAAPSSTPTTIAAAPTTAPPSTAPPSTTLTLSPASAPSAAPRRPRTRITVIVGAISITALAGVFVAGRTLGKRNIRDAAMPTLAPPSDAATNNSVNNIDAEPPADGKPDATPPVTTHADAAPLDAAPTPKPLIADARSPRDATVRTTTLPTMDAAKPTAAGQQRVQFGAKPWAYVTIDGNSTVYETPATVDLSVGSHRAVFTNPALGASKSLTIDVAATRDNRFVVDLTAP